MFKATVLPNATQTIIARLRTLNTIPPYYPLDAGEVRAVEKRIQNGNPDRVSLQLIADAATCYRVSAEYLLSGSPISPLPPTMKVVVDWRVVRQHLKKYIDSVDPEYIVHHTTLWRDYLAGAKKPGLKVVNYVFYNINSYIGDCFTFVNGEVIKDEV